MLKVLFRKSNRRRDKIHSHTFADVRFGYWMRAHSVFLDFSHSCKCRQFTLSMQSHEDIFISHLDWDSLAHTHTNTAHIKSPRLSLWFLKPLRFSVCAHNLHQQRKPGFMHPILHASSHDPIVSSSNNKMRRQKNMSLTLKWHAKDSQMKTTPCECIDERNKWCASCFFLGGSLFLLVNWTWPEIHFNQSSYDNYVLVQGSIDWDSSQKRFLFWCCSIEMSLGQPFERCRPGG